MLDETSNVPVYSGPLLMPDSELNSNVWKLIQKQCQLFEIVPICAKNVQKADQNPRIFEKVKPMQIFLTGGAGCGKSILMKIIHPSLTLSYEDVVIKKSISIAYGTCCYAN